MVGIPAHPVTADAGLETGAANWTCDTWVEFLADRGGAVEWRVFHPHEYPGMQPEPRGDFGKRGVANKGFNDLIVMANESWVLAHLSRLFHKTLHELEALQTRRSGGVPPLARLDVDGLVGS